MFDVGRRFLTVLSSVALVLSATMTQNAEAQRSGRSGLRLGHVTAPQLLVFEDVQKALKLTKEQSNKLDAIHEAFTVDRRQMFTEVSKESAERGAKLDLMNEQAATKITSVLDEAQRNRLQEILLQVNGPAALENETLATELAISDDQKSKLAEVRRGNARTRRETHAKLDGSSSHLLAKEMAELQRAGDRKLLEVLTDEQRKQFNEMQGEKIDLELYRL